MKVDFKKCRSKNSWNFLLSKVPDNNLDNKDETKNHRAISKDNELEFNNTCLGNGLIEQPLTDILLYHFILANNHAHK